MVWKGAVLATQEERRRATRARLIEATRALFLAHGVKATTTRMVLDRAGVSRGAMYHHFASQEDLVAAVYEEEAAAAIERAIARRGPRVSPLTDLVSACLAWLDEVSDPDVARIIAVEGPAALGWERCREIEAAHSVARMRALLDAAVREGEVVLASTDLAVRVLNAALTEAALSIVDAADKARARADAEDLLRQIVAGFSRTADAADAS